MDSNHQPRSEQGEDSNKIPRHNVPALNALRGIYDMTTSGQPLRHRQKDPFGVFGQKLKDTDKLN